MGRSRLMARLWNSWSFLQTFTMLFFSFHVTTGCNARLWRMMDEKTQEVAEVIHTPSSFFLYRRQLQTGKYCVAVPNADQTQLQKALDWACGSGTGQGNVDCSPLQMGGTCYNPNSLVAHASYVFNAYYIAQNAASTSCNFNGLATITTTNPSSGTCVFQAYTGSTTSTTPGTSTPPTTTSAPPMTTSTPPTTTMPPSNSTGTLVSPLAMPDNSTTTGTASLATSSFVMLPWLYALCGSMALITLFSKQ